MKLQVVLEPSDEGGYTVYIPSLPGCISEGQDVDEAIANIQEAVELHLESTEEAPEIAQFLDILLDDTEKNPTQLVPYSTEMDARLEELLDGVELDSP